MAQSDKLPPTLGALRQHVLRVHIQARVWGQASIALQDPQLDPLQNSYHKESDGQLKPTMTDALPAPKAIIEMVRCQCKTDCSFARCSCRTRTYPVLIFASAAVSVRMMRTHRTSMKLMMTMMGTIRKDSISVTRSMLVLNGR